MDILAQFSALLALLPELQAKLADAEATLAAASKLAYDKGFADGVASVVVTPGDKIFSQAEADAMVATAVEPLQKKIEKLELVVVGIDGKIAEALMVFKADLLLKVKEVDAIEDAALEELLK